jgi:oxalate decarboxylase/phosphoglucose isomerase-like protein (cupin superfamily)
MQHIKRFNPSELQFEYGLEATRLLPWAGLRTPFGGAYCIVTPHSVSASHVNAPADEEELFICISGCADVIIGEDVVSARGGDVVFIAHSILHYVRNDTDEPFHFYALWWNSETASHFLSSRDA